ncbi:MAG TPA: transporter, partial [Burkholderiaceae bacterium]|nr:transporter [Burkholderiaceae bacterium]
VLPVWLPDGTRGVGARRQLGHGAAWLVRTMPRLRHGVSALGVVALAFLLWRHDTLWQTELSSLSPVPAQALALDTQLRNELLAGDERTMVAVTGRDVQDVLRRVETVGQRLDALLQAGQLVGYDAITRFVPSLATQQRRRDALPDAAALQSRLEQATAGGSLRAGRLQPFVDDVQRAREMPPITPQSVTGTPVAPIAAALLVHGSDGAFTALLPVVRTPGPAGERAGAAIEQALSGIADAQAFNVGDELHRLYAHYLREAQGQALLGAAGVVLLMALWLRSLPRLLAVCKPLAVAVLLTMAAFAAAGIPLGILHLVGLLLVVAVGSNYSLFLDWLRHQGTVDDDTLASLLLANLTIVLSFGLVAASAIPALASIGRVVAPGALLALLLSAAYAAPRAPATVQQ